MLTASDAEATQPEWISRRNQWVQLQSFLWLPLLVLCGCAPLMGFLSTLREESLRFGRDLGLVLLGLASYWHLVRILRAGRTIADWITIGRFGLVLAGSMGLFVLRVERIELWLLLVCGVCLDLVDGWAARRFGGSEEGAVLDMETDQLTTLFLALLAHERVVTSAPPAWIGLAGTAFLLLPALKYGFALVLRRAPRANDPKPGGDNTRARRTCAIVLVGLLLCTAPVLVENAVLGHVRVAVGVALFLLLASSFAGDVRQILTPREASNPT